ncbi:MULTISPECIES: hypothetical protein [unclassified Okeania]|uniref:hypothetical protein n=1 Tax=unclassified Okeania TaxID=2634635 RepID=UPI0013BC6FD3|nr:MULTISPECIES: hypothetical protein [unclassified Okeania]NET22884.1 hypothetical protein [Okeania sp. SIO1H5]NET92966.1 hypothetical protein [Okeania sp. SIO1H2]
MNQLSCIIFLADTLEPGKGDNAESQHLRQLSKENLFQAVWLICDYTIKHLLGTNCLIHPKIILTRNWFLKKAKKPEDEQKMKQQ